MNRQWFLLAVFVALDMMLSIKCGKAQEYEFTYNPPPGIEYLETTVSKEWLAMNEETFKTEETDITARYFIECIDSSFLITSYDVSIEYLVNGEPANEPMFEFMENLEYQLEVDKNGQLVGIYGIEGALDSIYSQYEPEVRELMSRFFNEDIIYAIIIDDWNKSIGNFAGKKFCLGDKWTVVDTMLLLLGSYAYLEKTISFTEILECANDLCVQIEIEYSAKPDIPMETCREFIASMMDANLVDSLKIEISELKIYGVEERVINPSTMLIYSEYDKQVTEFTLTTETEGAISFRKEEIDENHYEYFIGSD